MNIVISMPQDAWNIVLKHVGNGPYVEVSNVIAEMQRQAQPQLSPVPAPVTASEPAEKVE